MYDLDYDPHWDNVDFYLPVKSESPALEVFRGIADSDWVPTTATLTVSTSFPGGADRSLAGAGDTAARVNTYVRNDELELSGEWTVEWHARSPTTRTNWLEFFSAANARVGTSFMREFGPGATLIAFGGSVNGAGAWLAGQGAPQHILCQLRVDGATTYLEAFVDGVRRFQVIDPDPASQGFTGFIKTMHIGQAFPGATRWLAGVMDNIRITKDVARAVGGADFTPPIIGSTYPTVGPPDFTSGLVSGVVNVNGSPAIRELIAITWAKQTYVEDGNTVVQRRIVGSTISDEFGAYEINTGTFIEEVIILALENYGQVWQPNRALEVGDRIRPTQPNQNGYVYEVTLAGSSGTEEPTWIVPTESVNTQTIGACTALALPLYWSVAHAPVVPEPQGALPWAPTDAPLIQLIDPSDEEAGHTLVGVNYSVMVDTSGNGRNFIQNTDTLRPQRLPDWIGANVGMTFTTRRWMDAPFPDNTADFAIVLLLKRDAVTINGAGNLSIYNAIASASSVEASRYTQAAYNGTAFFSSPNIGGASLTGPAVDSDPHIVVHRVRMGGTSEYRHDGALVDSADTSAQVPVNGVTNRIGQHRWGNDAFFMIGTIGFYAIMQAPSELDVQRMEGYLAHRFDLTAVLPVDHPFKINPPTNAAPALWTPEQLTDLAVWLDASDETTVTQAAGVVSQWNDKSANLFTFQNPTAPSAPSVGALLNGNPVIDFDGTDDVLVSQQAAAQFAFLNELTPVHLFCVFKPGNGADVNALMGIVNTGRNSSATRGYSFNFDDRAAQSRNNAILSFISGGPGPTAPIDATFLDTAPANTYTLAAVRTDVDAVAAQRSSLWVNGEATARQTNAKTETMTLGNPVHPLTLGAMGDLSFFFEGQIAEIIIVDGDLTDAERNRVEGYLAWKWGQQANLPVSHPHADAAPTV
jgi:hypothetical protein